MAKFKPKVLTEAEIDAQSTDFEREALKRYKVLQERCRETNSVGETDLLIWSECVGILAARNKRLGLVK